MAEVWYRVYEQRYAAPLDEFDNVCGVGTISVHCVAIPVIKHTEKGVWLNSFGGRGTFVRNNARKRYACPTKEEAYESFFARKARQLKILSYQIDGVQQAVALAKLQLGEHDNWLGKL